MILLNEAYKELGHVEYFQSDSLSDELLATDRSLFHIRLYLLLIPPNINAMLCASQSADISTNFVH